MYICLYVYHVCVYIMSVSVYIFSWWHLSVVTAVEYFLATSATLC